MRAACRRRSRSRSRRRSRPLSEQMPACLPSVAAAQAAPPAPQAQPAPDDEHNAGARQARPQTRARQARPQARAPRQARGRLSSYRIDREIGRGGMAVVYAGWHEQLERPVALKVLAEHLADDAAFRTRFLREARIAAKLHHPNLVQTYDIAEVDGRPSIVMELPTGGRRSRAVRCRARTQRRSPAGSRTLTAAASSTATSSRRTCCAARDGRVKIADFGIARAAEETRVTQIGTVLGTLRYLAPEQAEGRDVGPEADVYSLGVVLDELLDRHRRRADAHCCVEMRAADPAARPSAADVAAELGATQALPRAAPTRAGASRRSPRCGAARGRALRRRSSPRRDRVAAAAAAAARAGADRAGAAGGRRPRSRRATSAPAEAVLALGRHEGSSLGCDRRVRRKPTQGVFTGHMGATEDAQRAAEARPSDSIFIGDELQKRRRAARVGAEGDALAGERELDVLARLEDPPLDRGERDLERVGDLVVGEADHVAEEERHLQVDGAARRSRARARRSPRPARPAGRAPRAAARRRG